MKKRGNFSAIVEHIYMYSFLGSFPVPPVHIGDIEGSLSEEPLIFAAVAFILAVILIPTISITRKMKFYPTRRKHIYGFNPSAELTFEEKLKKAKIQPQKLITFGQNYLAVDTMRKKIFVQSPKARDGIVLEYGDIISYEIIKDDQVITSCGAAYAESVRAGEDGIICSDLRLVIRTKKVECPEVVLAFISFSIDSEFAFKEAMSAAREIAAMIEGIKQK